MGYYIETDDHLNKAEKIANSFNGVIVSQSQAREAMTEPDIGVICVVNNGPFEAAAFAFNMSEFEEFARYDGRPKKWVLISRKDAERESGYATN